MNSDKISRELNWKNEGNFDEKLEETVEWYVQHEDYCNEITKDVFQSTPWKKPN